jgi:hypothetical protein
MIPAIPANPELMNRRRDHPFFLSFILAILLVIGIIHFSGISGA